MPRITEIHQKEIWKADQAGISQRKLAREYPYSQAAISKFLNRIKLNPDLERKLSMKFQQEQTAILPVQDPSSEKEQAKTEILELAQESTRTGRKMFRPDILKTVQANMEAKESRELEREFQIFLSKLQRKAQRTARIDKYLSEKTLREMVEDELLEKPKHRYCLP